MSGDVPRGQWHEAYMAGWKDGYRNVRQDIRICWTCSDFVHHEHRWRWSAWLCGRIQWLVAQVRS